MPNDAALADSAGLASIAFSAARAVGNGPSMNAAIDLAGKHGSAGSRADRAGPLPYRDGVT
ncbi:hypothetical protein Y590_03025 [Methylobacterium sp. AMS5]|nr:hypothetical protein Y590_03025 [Methylobacterium sp. AMS5]